MIRNTLYKNVAAVSLIGSVALATAQDNKAPAGAIQLITEKNLVTTYYASAHDVIRLEALRDDAKVDRGELDERFASKAFAEFQYEYSKERALAPFIPTFGPNYLSTLGLEKRIAAGIDVSASVFTQQFSTLDRVIDEATRTGFSVSVTLDLWKNVLGTLDKSLIAQKDLNIRQKDLEVQLSQRATELDLRKLYWAMVGNQEKRLVTAKLLESAEWILKEAKRRQAQYIADAAEISRYKAQVADRRASLLALEYEFIVLVQRLKERLPTWAGHELQLGPYDKVATKKEVLSCAAFIATETQTPWKYTAWDELLALLDKSFEEKQRELDRSDDVNLKLAQTFRMSGVDQGYGNSFNDFTQNGQPGYQATLRLDVPLDRKLTRTQAARLSRERRDYLAKKGELESRVAAQHSQFAKLVTVLNQTSEALGINNAELQKAIDQNRLKYRQGRVPLTEVIQTQDALFAGYIRELDANLTTIETLLDYFKVFPETPCAMNQIGTQG